MGIIPKGIRTDRFKANSFREKWYSMGSRVERFRQARMLRRKCRFVFLFFLVLLVLGVCAADYSVNVLVKNEKKIGLIYISKYNDYYKASFLNVTFYIDVRKLSSDFSNMKNKAEEIFSRIDLF